MGLYLLYIKGDHQNEKNLLNVRKWLQIMSYLIKGLVPIILEKGMATHSSILAWRIPGTEEPGGLQSTGSQSWTRLRDSTNTSTHRCSDSEASACSVGDPGSSPESGKSEGGSGNLLQCSCLEKPMAKPGRLQSMGSQRVRHDFTFTHNTQRTHTTQQQKKKKI